MSRKLGVSYEFGVLGFGGVSSSTTGSQGLRVAGPGGQTSSRSSTRDSGTFSESGGKSRGWELGALEGNSHNLISCLRGGR